MRRRRVRFSPGFSQRSNLPRSTVTDAFGSVNLPLGFAVSVETEGGPSGSAWLFAPSGCQTYCSAPKVVIATEPAKCWEDFESVEANSIFTSWVFDGSLLMSMSDQSPSGRLAAYAVISTWPASSVM